MSSATEQIMLNEMMMVRKRGKYSPHESNYTRLFGTPERAAQTLYYDKEPICAGCALLDDCEKMPDEEHDTCLLIHYDALLEWLRG
jgi:hypothetical protein